MCGQKYFREMCSLAVNCKYPPVRFQRLCSKVSLELQAAPANLSEDDDNSLEPGYTVLHKLKEGT
jgi:hypothetical protein